ncbi:MAG: hypothetical protein ACOCRO_10730 [Halanaerobiales bacterium]
MSDIIITILEDYTFVSTVILWFGKLVFLPLVTIILWFILKTVYKKSKKHKWKQLKKEVIEKEKELEKKEEEYKRELEEEYQRKKRNFEQECSARLQEELVNVAGLSIDQLAERYGKLKKRGSINSLWDI